jgi:hypothetical protein
MVRICYANVMNAKQARKALSHNPSFGAWHLLDILRCMVLLRRCFRLLWAYCIIPSLTAIWAHLCNWSPRQSLTRGASIEVNRIDVIMQDSIANSAVAFIPAERQQRKNVRFGNSCNDFVSFFSQLMLHDRGV